MSSSAEPTYGVLSPWADADPVPVRGLTAPRVAELNGKRIGLFHNIKRAGGPILKVVERRLNERYPGAEFSWYRAQSMSAAHLEPHNLEKFKGWLRGVDAAVLAVAD